MTAPSGVEAQAGGRLDAGPEAAPEPVTNRVPTRRLDLLGAADWVELEAALQASAETPPPDGPLDGGDAPAPEVTRVVLDSAWTPDPASPPGLLPVRPAFNAVVEAHDLFSEALAIVDGWAQASGAADRLVVDGTSYWFRLREPMWHWVHERLLWRATIAGIEPGEPADAVRVPSGEWALIDVLQAEGRSVETIRRPAPPPPPPKPRPKGSPLRRLLRRVRRMLLHGTLAGSSRVPPVDPEPARRAAVLADRIAGLRQGGGPRAIVLTLPSSYQRFGSAVDGVRRDPNLGSVIPALESVGIEPVVVGWGARTSDPDTWSLVEGEERLLPAEALVAHWARPEEDAERVAAAVAALEAGFAALAPAAVVLEGLDIAPSFVAALRSIAGRVVTAETTDLVSLERLMADLRPVAVVTTQEHHRTPWLVAARRAGVRTYALQHGILYAAHPGYPGRRHPNLVLPDVTFVFGEYERRVLLGMGYREDEVAVSGSPRLDLDRPVAAGGDGKAERDAVRTELGVRPRDRLLVVAGVPPTFVRRAHFVHMLDRILHGPLPGVHLVFKQHPGERDGGPYRELLEGLAREGGYAAPPISVVRDVDLYRLLRAADAHLSQQSTVLTDAVMAGTPNLIASVEPRADILGYIAAGVATRVTGPEDLLAVLDDLHPPTDEARAAFLADHFRDGAAGRRIADAVRAGAGTSPGA